MPESDLITLCSDFVVIHFPDVIGVELADAMAMALNEAECFVGGRLHNVSDQEVRSHLRSYFDERSLSPGHSERMARTHYYRDLCSDWITNLNAQGMLDNEVDFAIDVAVSDARSQMEDGVWPEADLGRSRMFWILRKTMARHRAAAHRRDTE